MTNEEIEELKGLAASMGLYDDKNPCKRAVILGKAIKALEQEPCEDRMKYVQETVNTMLNACTTNSIKDKVFRNAARFVQNAIDGKEPDFEKIDEPEPCEDAVSRQAVNDLVDELARAISDERCCISRGRSTATIMQDILDLPSVTPKQRTGHWVEIGDEPYDTWECDNCGFVIDGSGCVDPEEYRDIYKYCPNCGAKMEGESE